MTTDDVTDSDAELIRSKADELFEARGSRSARLLPGLTLGALRLVRAATGRLLAVSMSLQVIGGFLLAAQVLIGKQVLTQMIGGRTSGEFDRVLPWLVALIGVYAGASLLGVLRSELQRLLGELVSRHSLTLVIDAAAAADLIDFERPAFHDRLERALVNAATRPYQMTTGFFAIGTAGVSSVAVALALFAIEPLLLVAGIVAAAPSILISMGLGRAMYRFSVQQTPRDRRRFYVQQLLTEKEAAKELRAYALAPFLRSQFADLYEQRVRALRKLVRERTRIGLLGSLISGAAMGGTLGLLVFFVSDRRISLAAAGAAAGALLLLGSQLQGLAGGLGALYESSLFIQDFNSFVRQPPRVPEPGDFPGADGERVGEVRLSEVSFTYPSRSAPSLREIDLEIRPGEVIALVGANGSGKTTLAKLLAALYEPTSGKIAWGGQSFADGPPPKVRNGTAILFQDFMQYYMSAHANIAMGSWDRSHDRAGVIEAARRAGAQRFIEDLAQGYDTLLGPQFLGGSDLSGGQWQRMALARAYFRDAELIILDEPTASLDPHGEAELFAAMRELFAGRTVVLISHRFASVRMADRIYVLDQGRIIEQGSHEYLMTMDGTYAEMFSLQAAAFGLDDSPLAT